MHRDYQEIERVFNAVVDQPGEERERILDEQCGSNMALRAEVEQLLSATENAMGDFMHVATSQGCSLEDAPPERVGQYQVNQLIASGGMGAVYEAMQEQPRRTVALKLMKGLASGPALRRFEYESEVLARLRHPGIAQIFEAGTHREGKKAVPYFAMEYIPGACPITQFAATQKFDMRQRLQLFIQVCDAVHHGHQKGIIHRDLKPGNILVDGQGQVKIIDFGVARATNSDVALTTARTDIGQLVGTIQYMSPEQVKADPYDLDTRSDVYALGLVLYELLCGQLPYDISKANVFEASRIILEENPARPSTLSQTIRGDIETITLKALEKDRERRYPSTDDLGADIRRYLDGEPISARPPSLSYQVRMFARRNKVAFAAITAAFGVLGAATVFSSWQYWTAEAARKKAVAAGNEAEERRAAEEREREKAEAVNRLVTQALISSDPNQGGAQEFLVTDAMEQAVSLLDNGELEDQPETKAALLLTITKIFYGNGRSAEALPLAEEALQINRQLYEGDHVNIAWSLYEVGFCLDSLGRSAEALPIHEESLAMRERLYVDAHLHVAGSLNSVSRCLRFLGRATEALPRAEAALEMSRRLFAGDHLNVGRSLNEVALCLDSLGRTREALAYYQDALAMAQRLDDGDDPDTAAALNNVAACHFKLGRMSDALSRFEESLAMLQRQFKGDHPDVATAFVNVACCLSRLGRWQEALDRHEAALLVHRRLYDGDHPTVALGLQNLATTLDRMGRNKEALAKFEESLQMRQRLFDGDHPEVADSLDQLGLCLRAAGRFDEALASFEAAREMRQRLFGEDHPAMAASLNNVGACLQSLGRWDDALPMLQASLEIYKSNADGDHPRLAVAMNNVASCLRMSGRSKEALPQYEAVLAMLRRLFEGDHPHVAASMRNVADCLESLEQPGKALPMYEASLEMRRRFFDGDHPEVAQSLDDIAGCLLALGRDEEALVQYHDALEMHRRVFGADHTNTLYPQVGLARTLISLTRYAEAEALLQDAAEQCAQSATSHRMHWKSVATESVKLYERWHEAEPDKHHGTRAPDWRVRLEADVSRE